MFGAMAAELDEIDLLLLAELQADADRTNVELARLAGLSPAATLGRHDLRSTRLFEDHVRALPQIIAADNVTGEMDYLLTVVARDVGELQEVLAALATRGGQRLISYLKLAEIKPPSRLPLEPAAQSSPAETPPARRGSRRSR